MTSPVDSNFLVALVGGIVLASYFLFLAWMTIDAVRSRKFLWLIFILGFPFVGAIVYFFVEMEHDYMKIGEKGK